MSFLHRFNNIFKLGLLYFFLPVFSLCVVVELGVRAFYKEADSPLYRSFSNPEWKQFQIFRADEDLFWTFRVDATIGGMNPEEGKYRIRINHEGFRGPDLNDPARTDATRIMFAGDSCVFGWSAPGGKTFPGRLLNFLSEDHPRKKFHSLFAGRSGLFILPGQGGRQKIPAALRSGFARGVVWCGSNDGISRVGYPDSEMVDIPFLTPLAANLRYEFHSLRWWQDQVNRVQAPPEKEMGSAWPETGSPRVTPAEFERNLSDIWDVCRENDSKLVVLTRQDLKPYPLVAPYNKVLRRWAMKNNIPIADVARAFATAKKPRQLYAKPHRDSIHPNTKGYDLAAQIVYKAFRETAWPE